MWLKDVDVWLEARSLHRPIDLVRYPERWIGARGAGMSLKPVDLLDGEQRLESSSETSNFACGQISSEGRWIHTDLLINIPLSLDYFAPRKTKRFTLHHSRGQQLDFPLHQTCSAPSKTTVNPSKAARKHGDTPCAASQLKKRLRLIRRANTHPLVAERSSYSQPLPSRPLTHSCILAVKTCSWSVSIHPQR